MGRFVDSVTVDSSTMSPPSTNMRSRSRPTTAARFLAGVERAPEPSHGGAIDSLLHASKRHTTAEITLDQVMGEAWVDLSWAGPNHAITVDDLKKGGAATSSAETSSCSGPAGRTRCTGSGPTTSPSHRISRPRRRSA
jgi:hypothetical protein